MRVNRSSSSIDDGLSAEQASGAREKWKKQNVFCVNAEPIVVAWAKHKNTKNISLHQIFHTNLFLSFSGYYAWTNYPQFDVKESDPDFTKNRILEALNRVQYHRIEQNYAVLARKIFIGDKTEIYAIFQFLFSDIEKNRNAVYLSKWV